VWSIREQILTVTHRWPQILLCCIVGSLLGWGISWLWPANYQAVTELYVGINIDATLSEHDNTGTTQVAEVTQLEFKDFIDYKNWQMANLNSFIFTNAITNDALSHLRTRDAYWNQVNLQEFTDLLQVYWRSAGKWRLVAQHKEALRASQAVSAWQEAILEHVGESIQASRSLLPLEDQLQANAAAQSQLHIRQAALEQVDQNLNERLTNAAQWSPGGPLQEIDRWLVWQTVAQANLGADWLPLLDAFPTNSQPAQSYIDWMNQAVQAIEQEIRLLNIQDASLETQNDQLAGQHAQVLQQSMGLSANLEIQPVNDAGSSTSSPDLTPERSTGLLMWVGGLLGLVAWFSYWLIRLGWGMHNGVPQ
jgi:hypothetical protein